MILRRWHALGVYRGWDLLLLAYLGLGIYLWRTGKRVSGSPRARLPA